MLSHYIATGFGGALGAMARLFVIKILPSTLFSIPFAILCVNVIGCFIMGALSEILALYWSPSDNVRYLLITGFLGGFTTFSAFSLEFGLLFQKNEFWLASVYVMLSVVLSLSFFLLGMKIPKLI